MSLKAVQARSENERLKAKWFYKSKINLSHKIMSFWRLKGPFKRH